MKKYKKRDLIQHFKWLVFSAEGWVGLYSKEEQEQNKLIMKILRSIEEE